MAKINKGGMFYGGNYIDSAGNFNPKTATGGEHKILYTYTDSNKCIGIDSSTIWVDTLPNTKIVSAGPFCIDAGVQSIKPQYNYGGTFSGGKYIDSAGTFNPKTATSGLHKIVYQFTDVNLCANRDSIYVRVNPLPDTRINSAGPYCLAAGVQKTLPKTNTGGKFMADPTQILLVNLILP